MKPKDQETVVVKKPRRRRRIFAKIFGCVFVVTLVFGGVCVGSVYLSRWVNNTTDAVAEKLTETKFRVATFLDLVRYETKIVTPDEIDINQLITVTSNRIGLNAIIGLAISDVESDHNQFRFRYEPSWEKAYSKKVNCTLNDEECKLYFSSVGLMQVSYPIWAEFCDVHSPFELFQPQKNVECGLKIIAQCIYQETEVHFRHASVEDVQSANGKILRTCFEKYNGSGPKAVAYADKVMSRLAGYTIADKELVRRAATESAPADENVVAPAQDVEAEYKAWKARFLTQQESSLDRGKKRL